MPMKSILFMQALSITTIRPLMHAHRPHRTSTTTLRSMRQHGIYLTRCPYQIAEHIRSTPTKPYTPLLNGSTTRIPPRSTTCQRSRKDPHPRKPGTMVLFT
ncbi:hypothetical protein B0O80DRAFT_476279 [Mortierella sp. GBAus27b]|nr:hypothetical protein B0O80DRAFT_476279 [Mortierella sp. GBAus27b]